MPKSTIEGSEVWEDRVLNFLSENKELADDPTLGPITLERLLLDTTNLLVPLMHEVTEVAHHLTDASNRLADAINDSHCSASKMHEREKENEELKSEYGALLHWQEELEAFRVRVHADYEPKSAPESLHVPLPRDLPEGAVAMAVMLSESNDPNLPESERKGFFRQLFGG